jgi:hypothetical protein
LRIIPAFSETEEGLDLLQTGNRMKEIHNLEKFTQLTEAEKRKICLAKMRKEEETRGKARRNKEKV